MSVHTIAWSPQGKFIAFGGDKKGKGIIQIWEAMTGQLIFTYDGHKSPVTAIAWDPSGRHMASAGTSWRILVWDTTTRSQLSTYLGHAHWIYALRWSPSGAYLASTSSDKTVQVWRPFTGEQVCVYRGHTQSVHDVTWSPDGQYLASASGDKTAHVWNALTEKRVLIYSQHTDAVNAIAWSPNGRYLASASSDKTVQVWHPFTGEQIFTYTGHTASVDAVAWSPASTFLASAGQDNTVQFWSAENTRVMTVGEELFIWKGHTDAVHAVVWSPDGSHLASASQDNTVQIRQIRELVQLLPDVSPAPKDQPSVRKPIKIFYSYAPEDEGLRAGLEKHLTLLKQLGLISDWHSGNINAGEERTREIEKYWNAAQIILLLISPSSIASPSFEIVRKAMERHEVGTARVIPILLRPVMLEGAPFGKLEALPTNKKPVTSWSDRNEAFLDIAKGIRKVVEELHAR